MNNYSIIDGVKEEWKETNIWGKIVFCFLCFFAIIAVLAVICKLIEYIVCGEILSAILVILLMFFVFSFIMLIKTTD